MLGIGDTVILGQPGEAFTENAVEFRKSCQQMGYRCPLFVTYANGSYAYMPPANAFAEGGYEVEWALRMGISRYVQERITAAYSRSLCGDAQPERDPLSFKPDRNPFCKRANSRRCLNPASAYRRAASSPVHRK